MNTYDLDVLTKELPSITFRGRRYKLRPISIVDVARIQKAREAIAGIAEPVKDGVIAPAYRAAIRDIVSVTVEGFPARALFAEYPWWWPFKRRAIDAKTLAALVQAIFSEIGNMVPGEDDLKNVFRPADAAGR